MQVRNRRSGGLLATVHHGSVRLQLRQAILTLRLPSGLDRFEHVEIIRGHEQVVLQSIGHL